MTGWHFTVYRARVCWIALARRSPFPRGFRVLGPEGGRFAFGQSRDEALAALREALA
jgi:hypothetical protein